MKTKEGEWRAHFCGRCEEEVCKPKKGFKISMDRFRESRWHSLPYEGSIAKDDIGHEGGDGRRKGRRGSIRSKLAPSEACLSKPLCSAEFLLALDVGVYILRVKSVHFLSLTKKNSRKNVNRSDPPWLWVWFSTFLDLVLNHLHPLRSTQGDILSLF